MRERWSYRPIPTPSIRLDTPIWKCGYTVTPQLWNGARPLLSPNKRIDIVIMGFSGYRVWLYMNGASDQHLHPVGVSVCGGESAR
jgi:hypothetical protein